MATEIKPVHVVRASEVKETNTGQTEGMIRQSALVNLTPQIVGTLMRAQPHSASAVHHHGEQDTVVYAVSGKASIVSEAGRKREDLSPGDWALIPANAEHQEVNDGDEEAVWVIVRAPGGIPVIVNLSGWGESLKGSLKVGGGPGFEKGDAGRQRLLVRRLRGMMKGKGDEVRTVM